MICIAYIYKTMRSQTATTITKIFYCGQVCLITHFSIMHIFILLPCPSRAQPPRKIRSSNWNKIDIHSVAASSSESYLACPLSFCSFALREFRQLRRKKMMEYQNKYHRYGCKSVRIRIILYQMTRLTIFDWFQCWICHVASDVCCVYVEDSVWSR